MMRRSLPASVAILLATPLPVAADGDIAHSVGVAFQPGSTDRILLPSSIGLLLSADGGGTFHWVCSDAIGYTGDYHPIFAVSRAGTMYATSFDGLRISRDDGCTWERAGAPLGPAVSVNRVATGPDDRVWVTTANGVAPNDVYVSTDGESFRSVGLVEDTGGWQSIVPATGDRVYVAGYRRAVGDTPPAPLFVRSDDGGETWQALPTGDLEFPEGFPYFHLLGASPVDPDLVFVRLVAANPPLGDAVYRSIDGGLEWTRVLDVADPITAFVVRADGDTVIVGTKNACDGDGDADRGCVRISRDRGASFERASSEPRMGCLAERGDGILFACGANGDPDRFSLGRSPDGETWTPVYRFSDTAGPLECPATTVQSMRCAEALWPPLCEMLGICPTYQAEADAGPGERQDDGGCACRAGGASAGPLPILLLAAAILRRRCHHSAARDSAGRSQRRMSCAALPDRR